MIAAAIAVAVTPCQVRASGAAGFRGVASGGGGAGQAYGRFGGSASWNHGTGGACGAYGGSASSSGGSGSATGAYGESLLKTASDEGRIASQACRRQERAAARDSRRPRPALGPAIGGLLLDLAGAAG